MRIRNPEEVAELINDIENRFPVGSWMIDGFHIWPLLRIEIGYYLNYKYINRNTKIKLKKRSILDSVFGFFKTLSKGLIKPSYNSMQNDKIYKRDVLFFSDGAGYIDVMGKAYEKYFDAFNDFFSSKNISALRIDMYHNYPIDRFSPSVFMQSNFELYTIKGLLFSNRLKYDFSTLALFTDFLDFCKSEGIDSLSLNLKNLTIRVRKLKAMQCFFISLLEKVKPKLVLLVCFQNDSNFALINLCHKLGVKCIDIQHGFQESLHPAYGRWLNVPSDGYNLLPHYFWCWGKSEAQTINEWSEGLNIHKPLAGGNLLLNLLSNKSNKLTRDLHDDFERKILLSSKFDRKKKIILFTLQWDTIGEDMLLPLYDAIALVSNQYNWWIRLHPVMLDKREEVRSLFSNRGFYNIELDFSSDIPLYIILSKTDVHITCSSAVVIEAFQFNVPSIVINQYGEILFKNLIEEGFVHKAFTGKDIVLCLDHILSKNVTYKDAKQNNISPESPELLYLEKIIKANI